MIKKLQLSLLLSMLIVPFAVAQTGTLTGTVTDAGTGETIPGANILITQLERGAASDMDGNYEIGNIPAGTYTLNVSFVGYQTFNQSFQIEANQTTNLNVEMQSGAIGLDEVVVTGYGTIDRQAFTGSASAIRADRFENVPVASIDQALQGNAPGVTVNSATGTPGAEQEIRIRGISSVNADVDPLFVIDGVPVSNKTRTQNEASSSLGVMASLNPADIESVTILKDAASTAPYGARGSNGVVVITTKSGMQGRTQYSFSAQRGFNNRAIEGEGALSAPQYDELIQQMGGNSSWDGVTNTDWGDVVRNDNAVQQEYMLSARGGNSTTNFYISGSIFGQEGPVIGSNLDRYSGKIDINHRFDDRVRISNSFLGSFLEQNGYLEGAGYFGNPILAEYFMLPTDAAYNEDGTPNIDDLGVAVFHPVYTQENDINRKRNYRAINNTNLQISIADNLGFSSRFAIDYQEIAEKYYRNRIHGDADDVVGSVNDINNRNINLVWQNILEYIWDLNSDNSFTLRGITETQKNYYEYIDAYGTGIAADGLVNLATTANPQGLDGETEDWGVQSFTGLVNYGYQNKLFGDLSYRYEGNSRFAEDNRWGSFWSIGAAYVLTEEDFLQNIGWLDYLKVKASYGKTGNAGIELNQYQAMVEFNSYNDTPVIAANQFGNLNLTWETAHAVDAGIEFELFEILSGGVTYFRRDSKDLLFDVELSRTTGHESQTQNIGELYNQGVEVELNASLLRTSNLSWNLGGNLTTVKNEVTKIPRDAEGNPLNQTDAFKYFGVEGYATGSWFMREWAGVDPENGDPLWYMDDGNGGRTTTNNYNQATQYYQGANALPTLYGGLNTRLDVMNFYVSANLYYAFGNKVYDNWARYLRSDGQFIGAFGQYERQFDRWQQPGDIAENPRPVPGGNLNSNQISSRFLYDGDFLRLKDLNIGYNIPRSALQNVGLTSATLYFQGRNLWTHVFDDGLKYDPEVRANGYTSLLAPPLKSVTFGIKFNF